jgi:MIF4G domain
MERPAALPERAISMRRETRSRGTKLKQLEQQTKKRLMISVRSAVEFLYDRAVQRPTTQGRPIADLCLRLSKTMQADSLVESDENMSTRKHGAAAITPGDIPQTSETRQKEFKRTLLNICQEEFNTLDAYSDWRKDKENFEKSKSSLSGLEREERETGLNFQYACLKKEMLGNVKFIGQLYKVAIVNRRIMRHCIESMEQKRMDRRDTIDGDDVDLFDLCYQSLVNDFEGDVSSAV